MIEESEKKYVYAVIAIVVIILIFVIIIIWKPNSKNVIESNLGTISNYISYEEIQKEKYSKLLSKILLTGNFNELYEKIDDIWLESNKFNDKEEVKKYLLDNFIITNSNVTFNDVEVLTSESAYIFKYSIKNNGKIVNVVVNDYSPYKYSISFDQDEISSLSGKTYDYDYENVNYQVVTNYVGSNIIQYELKVKNNSEDVYTWNFDNLSSITLRLNNGYGIGCSDVTSFASNIFALKKEGEFSVKLTFNISIDNQSKIKELSFFNVTKNNSTYEINVPLNGGE